MNTLLKLSPAIIILLIMIITIIKSIIKKNKNIPLTGIERLFLSSAQITISVIPDDVTDILKFACGTYSINNISKINWMDAINNQKNLTLEHIAIEFPSIEHEVFKNKLIIYGKYISRDKFGPVAYVFNSLPELAFDSENCQKIYSFIKAHTQKNRRVLLKIDYGNITSKSSQFTIGYDL